MNNFTYSEAGLDLTKRFEGLELRAYQDQGGVWTVGYGHTGKDVHGGMIITEADAEHLLAADVAGAVACVNRVVTVPIAQTQFDALVDFVFNLGAGSLLGSHLLRYLNLGQMVNASEEFQKWDHCRGIVVKGLLERREAEANLFLA